jgi:hypothetical protein
VGLPEARAIRVRQPLAVAFAVAAATTLVALVDPNHGHYPLCPTKYLTNVDCPFCGGLRAVHSMAHGHVVDALHHNLLVTLAAPLIGIWWLLWLRREWRGEPRAMRNARSVARFELSLLVLGLTFMVVRNLPLGSALASNSAT